MNPSPSNPCPNVIDIADEPHHHLVIDNEWVRAYAVEIGARESTQCHRHGLPYMLYVAGEADILSVVRNGDAKQQHLSPDYCDFAPPGLEHVVKNLGNSSFRNMIFEVLPITEKLHRPPCPAPIGGVSLTTLYCGQIICAQLIGLGAGSQLQVTGAGVICSPYEEPVEFISHERGPRTLKSFRHMEFLPSGSTAMLRCQSGEPVRALVVTLGGE